jgi:predicted esterase
MVDETNFEERIIVAFDVTGALTLASSMLYPKTLAGAAIFSGWVPLDQAAFAAKITPAAKQVLR